MAYNQQWPFLYNILDFFFLYCKMFLCFMSSPSFHHHILNHVASVSHLSLFHVRKYTITMFLYAHHNITFSYNLCIFFIIFLTTFCS